MAVRIYVPQVGVASPQAARVQATDLSPIQEGIGQARAAYEQVRARDGKVEAALTTARLRSKYLQRVREDQLSGRVGDNYTPTLLGEMDVEIEQAARVAENPYAREALRLTLADMRGDVETLAFGYEGEYRVAKNASAVSEIAKHEASLVADPRATYEQMVQAQERAMLAINGAELPFKAAEAMRAEVPASIADTYAETLSGDPARAQELLNDLGAEGRLLGKVTPSRADTYRRAARATLRDAELRARESQALSVQENYAAALDTQQGVEARALATGKPPSAAELDVIAKGFKQGAADKGYTRAVRNIDRAVEIGAKTKEMRSLTDAELQVELGRAQIELKREDVAADEWPLHKARHDAAAKAASDLLNARKADAAGQMERESEDVAAAWAGIDRTGADGGASVQKAIRLTFAAQAAKGIAPQYQRPMSNARAAALADAIQSNPDVGQVDAVLIDSERRYGQYWPDVFRQLLGQKLPAAYGLISDMPDRNARLLAIESLRKKQVLATDEASVSKTISGSLANNTAYTDLRASLQASRVVDAEASLDSLTRSMALELMERDPSLSASSAATRAVKMVAGRWGFIDSGGRAARVPGNYRVDDVATAARRLRAAIGTGSQSQMVLDQKTKRTARIATRDASGAIMAGKFVVFPAHAARGMRRSDAEEISAERIRANAHWVTNEKEDGVFLALGERPVFTKDGRRVEFSFNQLQDFTSGGGVEIPPLHGAVRKAITPTPPAGSAEKKLQMSPEEEAARKRLEEQNRKGKETDKRLWEQYAPRDGE